MTNVTPMMNIASDRVNPLPSDKILDRSKLKVFADNKTNVTEKLKSGLERVENIVGKGKNAVCFQKLSFQGC